MTQAAVTTVLSQVRRVCRQALEGPFVKPSRVRDLIGEHRGPGVYVVRKGRRIIYVGDSSNAYRRVWQNHIRGTKDGYGNSQFRKLIMRDYGVRGGRHATQWIEESCRFSVVLVDDHDLARAAESALIMALRAKQPLLNKQR